MTEWKWLTLALFVAAVLSIIRLLRILDRDEARVELDEEARRRHALGYATDLDTWRQIERQPGIRRTGPR